MGWLLRLLLFLLFIVVVMQALVRLAGGFVDGAERRARSLGRPACPRGAAMCATPSAAPSSVPESSARSPLVQRRHDRTEF